MLRHLDPTKIERHSETHILNFLLAATKPAGAGSRYGNVNGKRDLVLHLGETADTPVAVVLEVKGPKNPAEMLIPDDLNRKAFQQLLLYYLEDRSDERTRLQAALFREKRALMEHALFGVDLNPNSVRICRLRLWIELLKHAYYKPETDCRELETLPNLDLNVKAGNSLLARFALDADLSEVFQKDKFSLREYRPPCTSTSAAAGATTKTPCSASSSSSRSSSRPCCTSATRSARPCAWPATSARCSKPR